MSPRFVYANDDGPQPGVPTTFDPSAMIMTAEVGPQFYVAWQGELLSGAAAATATGVKRLSKREEVVLLRRTTPAVSSQQTLNASDHHIAGVDFRTKQGRRMDDQKKEYGQTFSNAAKKPTMMNDEEARETKRGRIKRARDATNELIEASAKEQDPAAAATPTAPGKANKRTAATPTAPGNTNKRTAATPTASVNTNKRTAGGAAAATALSSLLSKR